MPNARGGCLVGTDAYAEADTGLTAPDEPGSGLTGYLGMPNALGLNCWGCGAGRGGTSAGGVGWFAAFGRERGTTGGTDRSRITIDSPRVYAK